MRKIRTFANMPVENVSNLKSKLKKTFTEDDYLDFLELSTLNRCRSLVAEFEKREQLEDLARLNGLILGDLLGELKNVKTADDLAEFWKEHGAPGKGKTITNLTQMFALMPITPEKGELGEFIGRMGGLGIDFEVLKKVLKDISGRVNEVMESEKAKIQGWKKEGPEGFSKARDLQGVRARMKQAAEKFSKFKKFEEEEVPLPDVPEEVRKEYEGWREFLLNAGGRLPEFDPNPVCEKLCKLLEGEHGKQIHDLILNDLRSCADIKTRRDPDFIRTLSYTMGHLKHYKERKKAMERLFTDEMAAQIAATHVRVVRRGNEWLTDYVTRGLQDALDAYNVRQ